MKAGFFKKIHTFLQTYGKIDFKKRQSYINLQIKSNPHQNPNMLILKFI